MENQKSHELKAEIISVGTELLLGDIVNTNAQYLSRELAALGVGVYKEVTVGDNPARLLAAFQSAFEYADIVITTGGLGPTKDDLTKEIAAEYFGLPMVLDEESLKEIEGHFTRMGAVMTENNKRQAYMPQGAKILKNPKGTAPGCIVEGDGKAMIMLPGPPFEMTNMFENGVQGYLQKRSSKIFVSRILNFAGIGESAMEEAVKDIMETQSNPTIAPYAKPGRCLLRITASGGNEAEAGKLIEPVATEIYNRLGPYIYGEGNTSLEESVVALLKAKGHTLGLAESCTGGMVAAGICSVPGASEVFMEGAVTYSNGAKIRRLGVKAETLEKYGAVSPQTAEEMAAGICREAGVSVGLSLTGIAGPGGGTAEKPVGLVYVGLCVNGKVQSRELRFNGDRERIRARSVTNALDFLRKNIE